MSFNQLLKDYQIQESDILVNGNNHIITKLNWDYDKALEFQVAANQFVYENPEYCLYILTSHPRVLTMGRGLQRGMVEKHSLVEFDQELSGKLPVEVFNVKRGGGLTFHHPGQIVIYPIVHIAHQRIKTIQLMNKIFQVAKEVLEEQSTITDLEYERDLLGLWKDHHKLGSMGIQLVKFVSLHGLALNIQRDEIIEQVLKDVYPCGLNGLIYKSLEELTQINYSDLINTFKDRLISLRLNETV